MLSDNPIEAALASYPQAIAADKEALLHFAQGDGTNPPFACIDSLLRYAEAKKKSDDESESGGAHLLYFDIRKACKSSVVAILARLDQHHRGTAVLDETPKKLDYAHVELLIEYAKKAGEDMLILQSELDRLKHLVVSANILFENSRLLAFLETDAAD